MRVLAWFLLLLVLSTAASLLVLHQTLMSRVSSQVEDRLAREVGGFEAFLDSQRGTDGRELEAVLRSYLDRVAPPSHGVLATFSGTQPAGAVAATGPARELVSVLAMLQPVSAPVRGRLQTAVGEASYVAVPVTVAGERRGALAAAALLGPERSEVSDAIEIAIGVSAIVLLLASLFIWLAAGRVLEPLRELAATARTIGESDISRRIRVRGNDELAQLARAFNQMLDRLESAFVLQKEFLADIGHELRTPLTVIRGYLETAGDDALARREAAAVIGDEVSRMGRFVDDLLMLTRASRPDFLQPRAIDLDLLTTELLDKARALGKRSWRGDGTGVGIIRGDPDRLTQATMNLLDNALRHTGEDDEIRVGSSIDSGQARLWVRDSGPGVDPSERDRIFQRFAQVSDDPAIGRSGLGLAIVKAIAEAHGGHVELDSTPGEGSTFTIVLPTGALEEA